MDIALINPENGLIENVIVTDNIAHAQKFYPKHLCVERLPDQPIEPGGAIQLETDGKIKLDKDGKIKNEKIVRAIDIKDKLDPLIPTP